MFTRAPKQRLNSYLLEVINLVWIFQSHLHLHFLKSSHPLCFRSGYRSWPFSMEKLVKRGAGKIFKFLMFFTVFARIFLGFSLKKRHYPSSGVMTARTFHEMLGQISTLLYKHCPLTTYENSNTRKIPDFARTPPVAARNIRKLDTRTAAICRISLSM